jgi:hypothetical protein
LGLILPSTRARGSFSTVPRAAGYLFRIEGASARLLGRRWYTNLGPEPKICAGRILGGVLGASVEMI